MAAMRPFKIAGSILAGDVLDLAGAIKTCERAGADIVTLDVSDGHFVPTLSFGEDVVRRTCQVTKLPVEVHLMVARPEDWVVRMAGCGQFRMVFHLEASSRVMGVVQAIAKQNVLPGIAINPETSVAALEPLLPHIDNACIMGIAPGFAGQAMLETTFGRVETLRRMIDQLGVATTLTVDGGVKAHNARRLVESGADILVVSSAMYGHENPDESLNEIRRSVV